MSESKIRSKLSGKVVIIPGGSKGIGKAIALEFSKYGAHVCIIARNKTALSGAAKELEAAKENNDQTIESFSCDTTDMKALKPMLTQFIKKHGTPDYLINCVGYAYPQYIEKLNLKDFENNMNINYYGQLVPLLICLPYFIEAKKGHIVNCSSASGFLGMMGYATYTPTKFALVGLTEGLRHELKPHGIKCSILYPVDTDTPGFENENKSKPIELSIMSESGGLMPPAQVAEYFIKKLVKNKFYILPGQSGFLWRIVRHFPRLTHWILDGEYTKAIKKAKKR